MVISPAPADYGIRFLRKDISDNAYIEAVSDYVTYTQRGTTLENGEIKIATLEHLLATFVGMGIDNALITIDSFEVPILDGSALPYVRAFAPDGLEELEAAKEYLELTSPIYYKDEKSGSEISVTPADEFSVDLTIDFGSKILGRQSYHYDESVNYITEVAPCRTFVFYHELEFLFRNNLIQGGDLENALVIMENEIPDEEISRMASLFNVEKVGRNPNGYLDNVQLRFPNECARHKLLDLLGDFSLVGKRMKAHVRAVKSGHQINTMVAKMIRDKEINKR